MKDEDTSEDPEEFVLAVFVVRFDTNQGNVIEWSYPESMYTHVQILV